MLITKYLHIDKLAFKLSASRLIIKDIKMFSLLEEMRKRKNATYRLDELIVEKIAEHAKNQDMSANNWLESYLFNSLKSMGIIDTNEVPIGETRGGDRKSKNYQQEK